MSEKKEVTLWEKELDMDGKEIIRITPEMTPTETLVALMNQSLAEKEEMKKTFRPDDPKYHYCEGCIETLTWCKRMLEEAGK